MQRRPFGKDQRLCAGIDLHLAADRKLSGFDDLDAQTLKNLGKVAFAGVAPLAFWHQPGAGDEDEPVRLGLQAVATGDGLQDVQELGRGGDRAQHVALGGDTQFAGKIGLLDQVTAGPCAGHTSRSHPRYRRAGHRATSRA